MKASRLTRACVSLALVLLMVLSPSLSALARPDAPSVRKPVVAPAEGAGRPLKTIKPTATRVSGSNAVAEAVALSRDWKTARAAVLVGKGKWSDAMLAPALAGALDAPIMVTSAARLDGATATRLSQMRTTTVYVIGSTKAVSPAVVRALGKRHIKTIRLTGSSSAEAARVVALRIRKLAGSTPTIIALAAGDYADAAAVSAYSAAAVAPVLITNKTSVPAATKKAISSLQATMTVVVGSTAQISSKTASAFPGAVRMGGKNVYDTSVKLADFSTSRGMSLSKTVIASGSRFPDAVLAGAWAARQGSPILLTTPTRLSPEVEAFISDTSASYKTLRVLGTTRQVTAGVVTAAVNAATSVVYDDVFSPGSEESSLAVSAVASETIDLTGPDSKLSEIATGSILVGDPSPEAPSGFFRKVTATQRIGAALHCATVNASIADVIADGGIEVSSVSGPSKMNAAGIVLWREKPPARQRALCATDAKNFKVPISLTFKDQANKGSVTLSGEFSDTVSVTFAWHTNWGIPDLAEVRVVEEQRFELALDATVNASASLGKLPILPYTGLVRLPVLGPVYIAVSVQVEAELKVEGKAGMKLHFVTVKQCESGFRWTPENGSQPIAGDSPHVSTWGAPDVFGSGAVVGQFKLYFKLMVEDTLGPTISVGPFLKLAGTALLTSGEIKVVFSWGVKGTVGGEFRLFGKEIRAEFEFPITPEYVIFEVTLGGEKAQRDVIAFAKDDAIWTVEPDGSGERRVCGLPPAAGPLRTWPGDPSKVQCGLHMVDLENGKAELISLSPYSGYSVWRRVSPDGKSAAFLTENRLKLRRDGAVIDLAAAPPGSGYVEWSPDGRFIAFMGGSDWGELDTPDQLYLVDVAARKRTQLTRNNPMEDMGGSASIRGVQFSGDGKYLAYMQGRRSDSRLIYILKLDSLGAPPKETAFADGTFAFSPSGHLLVYSAGDLLEANYQTNWQVFIKSDPWDGEAASTGLTRGVGENAYPSISYSGDYVQYSHYDSHEQMFGGNMPPGHPPLKQPECWVVKANGTGAKKVVEAGEWFTWARY